MDNCAGVKKKQQRFESLEGEIDRRKSPNISDY